MIHTDRVYVRQFQTTPCRNGSTRYEFGVRPLVSLIDMTTCTAERTMQLQGFSLVTFEPLKASLLQRALELDVPIRVRYEKNGVWGYDVRDVEWIERPRSAKAELPMTGEP